MWVVALDNMDSVFHLFQATVAEVRLLRPKIFIILTVLKKGLENLTAQISLPIFIKKYVDLLAIVQLYNCNTGLC